MAKRRKALICPLDWGIGHATRCIPVISKLKELGFEVVVAASGRPLEFIRREFPDIPVVDFPGTAIHYPRNGWIALKMLQLLPRLLLGIYNDHRELRKIAAQSEATLIISDNRFGCWHADIPSVFVTHQLDIQVPAKLKFLHGLLNSINFRFINKYNTCWIPDFEPHRGIAGILSHPPQLPSNAHYIGILSRFSKPPDPFTDYAQPDFDILVMLSGPEPQRTILEEKILITPISLHIIKIAQPPSICIGHYDDH